MRRSLYLLMAGLLLAGMIAGCSPVAAPTAVPTAPVQNTSAPAPTVVPPTAVPPAAVSPTAASAVPAARKWQLVNPEGVVVVQPVEIAPRITSLEGKTVALYWNGKHNGNNFLNRVAELLTEQVPGIKLVKIYEEHPETATISNGVDISVSKAQLIAGYKPDLVMSSQCD